MSLRSAAAVVLLLVTGLAVWQWIDASRERDNANDRLILARNTSETLVSFIAKDLRRAQGLRNDTLLRLLDAARNSDLVLIAIGAHDEMRFADSAEVLAAFHAAFEDTSAPCVALMANSDNLGPHDGSLIGERFLDDLLLPGRAVVLTVGNLNQVASSSSEGPAWHAFAQPGPGRGPTLPLVLRYDSGAASPDAVEVWFRPPAGAAAGATIAINVDGNAIGPPITMTESATPATILTPAQNPKDMTTVDAQLQRDDEADAYCLQLVFRPAPSRRPIP